MNCPDCDTEVVVITEIVTDYQRIPLMSYDNPDKVSAIGKLIFSKLVQCPKCKKVTLLQVQKTE